MSSVGTALVGDDAGGTVHSPQVQPILYIKQVVAVGVDQMYVLKCINISTQKPVPIEHPPTRI